MPAMAGFHPGSRAASTSHFDCPSPLGFFVIVNQRFGGSGANDARQAGNVFGFCRCDAGQEGTHRAEEVLGS